MSPELTSYDLRSKSLVRMPIRPLRRVGVTIDILTYFYTQ